MSNIQALAWYNELMMEHTEIFWSLFAVDMDDALEVQLNDTWDSFLLFQMLNNYLRMECKSFELHVIWGVNKWRDVYKTYFINVTSFDWTSLHINVTSFEMYATLTQM